MFWILGIIGVVLVIVGGYLVFDAIVGEPTDESKKIWSKVRYGIQIIVAIVFMIYFVNHFFLT